jgi:PTH1 family peptidyl-tRNA hydrolase
MNASGRAVQMIASFFKIAPSEILVVHDELDFAPGVAKMKQGGGIAGHNGLRDISARLGSHDYWRLRIGVGHPGDRSAVVDYVLNKPSADDRVLIDDAIARALDVMPLVVGGDMQSAMLKLHTPDKTPESSKPAAPKVDKTARAVKAEKPPDVAPVAPVHTVLETKPATPSAGTGDKKGALKSLLKKFLPDQK